MKKTVLLLLTLVLFVSLFAACGGEKADDIEVTPGTLPEASDDALDDLVNPMIRQDTEEPLLEAGLPLKAPEDAENVMYFLFSTSVGQTVFTWNEREYSYRGAKGKYDYLELADIDDEFSEELLAFNAIADDDDSGIRIYQSTTSGKIGTWQYDGNTYTVYTDSDADDASFCALCSTLFLSAHESMN